MKSRLPIAFLALFACIRCTNYKDLAMEQASKDSYCPKEYLKATELASGEGFIIEGCAKRDIYIVNRGWFESKAILCPPSYHPVWEKGPKPEGISRGQCARLRAKSSISDEKAEWYWNDMDSCPVGTKLQGAAPPKGTELWCQGPNGKMGHYTEWWPNGTKKVEGFYMEGTNAMGCSAGSSEIKHGKWQYWTSSGMLSRTETWYYDDLTEAYEFINGRSVKKK